MVQLPDMPARIARLPRDHRGFPVPWFVQWFSIGDYGEPGTPTDFGVGAPDFRVVDTRKLHHAIRFPSCWVCGEPMGQHRVFIIGPMCAINRVISEPPSHRECAEFSARACPFLSQPRMRRNEVDLPPGGVEPGGIAIRRNPGVICLWETRDYKPTMARAGNEGVLFRLGEPTRVDWWSRGRPATRDEVLASIESGLPALERECTSMDDHAMLHRMRMRMVPLLPADVAA
jgi:hypothetical protein